MYTCIDVPHTRTRGSSLPDNIAPIFECIHVWMCRIQEPGEAVYLTIVPLYLNVYMYRCAAYKNQGKQST